MGDEGEYWRDVTGARQEKREANKQASTKMLIESGVNFTSHNNGNHLIVQSRLGFINFWPSTGQWRSRSLYVSGRGIKPLLRLIGDQDETI